MNESDKCRSLQTNFKTPEIFKLSLEDQLCYLQSAFVEQKFDVLWLRVDMRFSYFDVDEKVTWSFDTEVCELFR